MIEDQFEYGPIAKGIFTALLWMTVLVAFAYPKALFIYIPFLQFLASGLKPLLIKTGLYHLYSDANHKEEERRWRKITEQRCAKVEKEKRNAKYKYRLHNDNSLPRNW